MVRPQPPSPEVSRHIDDNNHDFNRRAVKHLLIDFHSHDHFDDLVSLHDNVDDQHNKIHINRLHLPILKGRVASWSEITAITQMGGSGP
jgi:hypothetical protein